MQQHEKVNNVPRAARIAGTSEPWAAETRRAGEGGGRSRSHMSTGRKRTSFVCILCMSADRSGSSWLSPVSCAVHVRVKASRKCFWPLQCPLHETRLEACAPFNVHSTKRVCNKVTRSSPRTFAKCPRRETCHSDVELLSCF